MITEQLTEEERKRLRMGQSIGQLEWYDLIDWKKVTKEHTDYTLSAANATLKMSLESCQDLDKKSFQIMFLSTGCILFTLAFIFNSTNEMSVIPAYVLITGFLASSIVAMLSMKARKYITVGNYPKHTLESSSLEGDYLSFLHSEIVPRQDWIEQNEGNNSFKGLLINISLALLTSSMVLAFLSHTYIRYFY